MTNLRCHLCHFLSSVKNQRLKVPQSFREVTVLLDRCQYRREINLNLCAETRKGESTHNFCPDICPKISKATLSFVAQLESIGFHHKRRLGITVAPQFVFLALFRSMASRTGAKFTFTSCSSFSLTIWTNMENFWENRSVLMQREDTQIGNFNKRQ